MAADADGNHEIDIDAMARKIEEKVSGEMPISPLCSIFRIPITQLSQNLNAYVPDGFSFGPFHHGKENLEHTEMIKANYLRDLISRLSPSVTRLMMIKRFTAAISNMRKEARECYSGPIGMEEDKFVEVLVLDGCFIIELLRKYAYAVLREENDPIFSTSFLLQYLWHDLILLENQIPWMVLDILFNLTCTSVDMKRLIQLAIDFFGNIFSTQSTSYAPLVSHPSKQILDLLRNSLVLNSSMLANGDNQEMFFFKPEPMPSAKSLLDSGIRFKMGISESILDIRFHQKEGILEIPTLFIHETTETLFRNLISLEQCCPNYDPIISSYAVLFDNLMKSKDDMEILSNSRAIYNWLNIDDARRLFNKLYIDTFVKEMFYLKLTHEVNEYCRHRWQTYRRVLLRDYMHDPWTFTSVNVAIIALILTFIQTVFAIIKE